LIDYLYFERGCGEHERFRPHALELVPNAAEHMDNLFAHVDA